MSKSQNVRKASGSPGQNDQFTFRPFAHLIHIPNSTTPIGPSRPHPHPLLIPRWEWDCERSDLNGANMSNQSKFPKSLHVQGADIRIGYIESFDNLAS